MPNISFHDLRHTYSTLLLINNYDLKAISELLGHASTIITSNVYFDKNRLIIDCTKEMNGYVNRVKPNENKKDRTNPILNDLDTNFMVKRFL